MRAQTKTAPNDAANVIRGLTDAPDSSRRPAMDNSTARPTDAQRLALIRSLAGHSDGHEDRALAEIAAVIDGATLADLLVARGGGR